MPEQSPALQTNRVRFSAQTASLLLFCAYVWLLSYVLPEGINQVLSSFLLIVCSLGAAIALLLSLRAPKASANFAASDVQTTLPLGDLLLLSLPLTPIVQYLLLNQETMNLVENAGLLAMSLGYLSITIVLAPGY